MSSVAAAYSQVPVRSKYLVARGAAVEYVAAAGVTLTSVIIGPTVADVLSAAPSSPASVGDLFRDKGKRITVVESDGTPVATFALVRRHVDAALEDDADEADVLVRVWDATTPSLVLVVAGPA